jgi:hypothetical protein
MDPKSRLDVTCDRKRGVKGDPRLFGAPKWKMALSGDDLGVLMGDACWKEKRRIFFGDIKNL